MSINLVSSQITKDMLQVQHSSMASKISTVIFKIFLLSLQLHPAKSKTWIRVGYYVLAGNVFPISETNSSLFTHLIYCCADLSSTSYTLTLSKSDEKYFSTFTETVKQKNPSVTTLLSIGSSGGEYSIFSSMVNSSVNRKSFIDSSITTARRYGFEGLEFNWASTETASDMSSLSILFEEWRAAITFEARNSSKSELIMTAVFGYSPDAYSKTLRIHPMQAAALQDAVTIPTAHQEGNKSGQNKSPHRFLVIILPITAAFMLLLGLVVYFWWMRKLKSKVQESRSQVNNAAATGDFNGNSPTLILYSLVDIETATDKFSIENKLGEGGYGPVFKGVLQDGLEVAVKKLSKTSRQGFEEFKNEVSLTAKLQHVNLVRLLGFCNDREEHMLIYEYMSNKSLDYYLFDPVKKFILDWKKRVHIIEGGLSRALYLQEYSRLPIIHRDLKASNVLLNESMKPKISDFGMARIFTKDGMKTNTSRRIVGTYGYASPEYLKKGIYSTKSDVYSFGVLVLQIISGKRVSIFYGENNHLSLLEYAYELWKDGKGMEFMDPSLDDTYSPCTLIRCLHIALLCVQKISVERPSMLEVSWMLRNEATDLRIPNKPGFAKKNDEDVQYESTTSNMEIGSVNDMTISDLEAR